MKDKTMNRDLEKILYTEEEIKAEVEEAAKWLDGKFKGKYPLCVGILKGSAMFCCDLVRAMKTAVELDFMTISSYGNNAETTGEVKVMTGFTASAEGRDVILVEDIVDSGHTLLKLRNLFAESGARSVTAVTLLDKPVMRHAKVTADYSCFRIGEGFVVGYGLDYAQKYRDLPYLGILKREIYEEKH